MDQPQDLWQQGLEIIARIEAEELKTPTIAYPVFHSPYPTLTLEQIYADLGHLPQKNIILGICDDGLPVLFDLNQLKTGSILIAGDQGSGKTTFLQTIISSACLTNSAREVQISVISQDIEHSVRYQQAAQIHNWVDSYETETRQILQKYLQITEQRRYDRETGPALLLIIDDVDRLLQQLDDESYQALLWLVKNGPGSQVWVIASLGTPAWNQIPAHVVDAFHTWLVGHIEPYQTGTNLAQLPVESACCLIPQAQFSLSFSGEWLPFWIPAEQR